MTDAMLYEIGKALALVVIVAVALALRTRRRRQRIRRAYRDRWAVSAPPSRASSSVSPMMHRLRVECPARPEVAATDG